MKTMKNLKFTLVALFMIALSSVQAQINPLVNLGKPYRILNGPYVNNYSNLDGLTTQFLSFSQDISTFSNLDGNRLECFMRDGYDQEFWVVTNVGGNFYTIRNNHANLSVDNLGSNAEGAGIVNKVPNTSDGQKWQFVSIGDNLYKITNKVSGKALTRSSKSISQKNYTGIIGQKWRLSDNSNGNLSDLLPEPKVTITSIFPNPVTGDYMNVKINIDRSGYQDYKIFNMDGQQSVFFYANLKKGDNTIQVYVRNLIRSGEYVFTLYVDGRAYGKKFLVRR
jgi:Ricin-type beta-trefoil lectin domain-like/Secretion system C-terminal sorting domain